MELERLADILETAAQALREMARVKNIEVAERSRFPIEWRRDKIRKFLHKHGSATRREIITATGVPDGSFTAAMKSKEFCKVTKHLWGLR
jgi:hypothetical protein